MSSPWAEAKLGRARRGFSAVPGGLSGHWMEMLFLLGPAAGGHWRRQEKRRPGLQALVGRRFLQYAKRSQEQWGISA